MKDGVYYSSLDEFLSKNKDSNTKKFLLVGEYTNFDIEKLRTYSGEIIGGIVPFIVFNNDFLNKGTISCDLSVEENHLLIEDINCAEIEKDFFSNCNSLLVLLDGLSPSISNFLHTLFENVPENTQIIGGGAGKMTFEKEPVIFTKDGMYQDSAILVSLKSNLTVAVENGWENLEGPFLVTNSENNVLKTLNFENAFQVYKGIVEKDSNKRFTDDNFFDIAKSHPLGIVKYDKNLIVRDPIYLTKDNHIVLVGDIPKNSTICILKGTKENLVKSSGKAVQKALSKLNNKNEEYGVVVFDCISRAIFLGDDFNEEISEIKKYVNPNRNLFGALTLGEIANNGDEYIIFYNKTCVIGLLC